MPNLPNENIQNNLKTLTDKFRMEDKAVRERQLRQWKRLNCMWEGFFNTWWDSVAHDWRVYDLQNLNGGNSTTNGGYYDRPANIFKALLESIIAALSVSVPPIVGTPDDADNPLDLQTARAASKIADLVGKHNDSKLFWLHGLFTYVTQGLTAAYNYTDENESYGSYTTPKFKNEEIQVEQKICPICKINLGDEKLSNSERDEYDPGNDDVLAHGYLNEGQNLCPQCLIGVDPELMTRKIIVERLVGYINNPKARQCIEVYGGLFVKVPNYAMTQKECPYLCLSKEVHYSKLIEDWCQDDEDLADRIRNSKSAMGNNDAYERWARISPQYMGEYPLDTPTLNQWWIRPWAFESLSDARDVEELKKKYPDGVKVVYINDQLAKACNESLDDHWTLIKQPMSNYIHFQPLGQGLIPMQEMTNEMISLTLQTIEHGIPTTFADPGVLNFEAYSQLEATPGQVVPTKPLSSSKSVAEGFYEVKTATLSQEVMPFIEFIQQMAQMVSGALPSLWGGAQPNSSKTAAQYQMSHAQSLQRLQNTWEMFCVWWKEIHGKVIPAFIENLVEDERYVAQDDRGNFFNVFIRKAELQGKIGSIEVEAAEQLPRTWREKKDTYMQLLASANPLVQQAMTAPENLELVKSAIGIPDFVLPGADQREAQFDEINALVASAPISNIVQQPGMGPMGPAMIPQEVQETSVEINPFDNDGVHAAICVEWLTGLAGRTTKKENPPGYLNVLLHWQKHTERIQMMEQQQQMQQAMMNQSKVSQPDNKGNGKGSNANNNEEKQPVMGALRANLRTQ